MSRAGGGSEGLLETMRARAARVPWLDRHLGRLSRSARALGMAGPREDIAARVAAAAAAGDCVVRVELRDGGVSVTTRAVSPLRSPAVIVAAEPHVPYPHKTTARDPFERAMREAGRAGADDALLVTPDGYVAEGTAWNVFWWDGESICTPAAELGILPGIGRARVMEVAPVREVRASVAGLQERSVFLVNAVRGIVPLASLGGAAVPVDPRTAALSLRFWPD